MCRIKLENTVLYTTLFMERGVNYSVILGHVLPMDAFVANGYDWLPMVLWRQPVVAGYNNIVQGHSHRSKSVTHLTLSKHMNNSRKKFVELFL